MRARQAVLRLPHEILGIIAAIVEPVIGQQRVPGESAALVLVRIEHLRQNLRLSQGVQRHAQLPLLHRVFSLPEEHIGSRVKNAVLVFINPDAFPLIKDPGAPGMKDEGGQHIGQHGTRLPFKQGTAVNQHKIRSGDAAGE